MAPVRPPFKAKIWAKRAWEWPRRPGAASRRGGSAPPQGRSNITMNQPGARDARPGCW